MDFHEATGGRHFYFSQLYIKNTASHIARTYTSASLKAHRFIPYTHHAGNTLLCADLLFHPNMMPFIIDLGTLQ